MPRQSAQQIALPLDTPSLSTSTLRPGCLVGLKTSVTGNVSYQKNVLEPEHRTRSGAAKEKWETIRIVTNPEEHKKANAVRLKARMIVVNVCATSAFGLLCPESELPKLELAVREARRIINDFNRTATLSRVSLFVITGRIAQDDREAVKAINSEVRDLLRAMSDGVKTLDVKAIRDAAVKARNIGSMLSPEAAAKIKDVIETARGAARKIVKAGETAAQEIDREAITRISEARTAFLELDDPNTGEMGVPEHEARAIDFDPDEPAPEPPPEPQATGRTRSRAPARGNPPRKGKAPPAAPKKAVRRTRRGGAEART